MYSVFQCMRTLWKKSKQEMWKEKTGKTIENLIGVSDDFTEKNIIEQICDRCEEVSSG